MDQRETILEGLADGRSLRSICREDGMPSISTVMRWLGEDEAWQAQYARARAAGDDAMAEDIQDIADSEDLDPNDRRVRIDARKWLLGKRQPKKYGDRVETVHSGAITTSRDMGDDELAAIAAGSSSGATGKA